MVDQMVSAILQRVKDRYPAIDMPGAMRAVVTSAAETGETYTTECKIFCEETGKTYHCYVERPCYIYSVRILDNDGRELPQYPEMIEIGSRQQLEAGAVVQVVFLGNELEAALVGG